VFVTHFPVLDETPPPPPPGTAGALPNGAGGGEAYGSYAFGRKPVTLTLCRFPPLVPYIAVLLLLAVLGRSEHPTIPNKDALAVTQSNR
jgi:hypothetical protein